MSADTRGLSFYNSIVNLSVNQTTGRSSHKWLLVFSTVGLCGNDPRSQIPFGWFLTMWISEPVISVDTVFGPNLPGQTWAKEFQDLSLNLIATIATDNTMVVAYLRSEGSKSGPLCTLLWKILTWCSRKQAQAQHIHALTMSRLGIHCVETQCLVLLESF